MTTPIATQTRRIATQADGSTAYEVTTRVTEKYDLPTASLFVVTINDPLNPKADALARVASPIDLRRLSGLLYVKVDAASISYISGDPFARVANIEDLTAYQSDRAEAVRRGQSVYLTDTFSALYSDPTTADAAYRQIISRLSELVTNWRTYTSTFETRPTQSYPLPSTPLSVEDLRREAYSNAVTLRTRAEEVHAAAQAAYERCTTDCALDRTIHAMLLRDVTFLERARARVVAIIETDSTNAKEFVLKTGSYISDVESYENLLVQKRADLNTYAARVQACQDNCAQLQVSRDSAQSDVRRALADEQRALADVRAVCPTFVP